MTPCLAPEEFVDLVDGTLAPVRRQHVGGCAACRATAAEVREALALAASDEVPEPSALFWLSINARVRAEIDRQAVGGWHWWMRWSVVVPAGTIAAVVLAVVVFTARPPSLPPTASGATEVASVTSPPADAAADGDVADDTALALVADLSQALPDGGWDALGVVSLPDLADAASVLSAEEQAALADLLRAAVGRPTS